MCILLKLDYAKFCVCYFFQKLSRKKHLGRVEVRNLVKRPNSLSHDGEGEFLYCL